MTPKRLIIIGVLFCIGGLTSIWDTISNLMESHININFGFFMLPIGIGIIRGKSSSQWWARFWIFLGYISCILITGLVVLKPEHANATWFDEQFKGAEAVPYTLGISVTFFILLFIMHRLLYSKKSKRYFNQI